MREFVEEILRLARSAERLLCTNVLRKGQR